ncbi:MAG: EAL domain-containing protein [Thiotrichales bacterium]|nr:EAL domain-containing protein [Thiotrichales bacterium]
MTWSFYSEGRHIQETVEQQAYQTAKQELADAIKHTLEVTQSELLAISDWDEVHQQFHDPSYYFYWHDERLKESSYYRDYYDALELYKKNQTLLTPSSPNKQRAFSHETMANTINRIDPHVAMTPDNHPHLIAYQAIIERGSNEHLGYVGVSLDLKTALLKQNQFYYLDKTSIDFSGNQLVSIEELMSFAKFKPISNPINPYLWELIERFIVEMIIILGLVSLVLLFIFNQLIRQPLLVLSNYLQTLKASPHNQPEPPKQAFLIKEYEELKSAIHQYNSKLQLAHIELDQQNIMVWEQARRDALTNVYNRRAFDETWSDVIRSFKENSIPTAFILFDCDFFKALNDTYGHEVGDEVIRLSAKSIQQSLPMECPPYRIGGDEFAVIIQHHSMPEIYKICEHTLEELKKVSFISLGVKENLSFSVGISSIAMTKEDCITRLPRQADIAMYKAKQSHHTKIQAYNQLLEDQSSVLVSNEVINTVVNSIHTGENIQMHYQPIVSIDNDRCYFEALIRIQGEHGLIYPGEIFSLVERRRLEVELDQQVIKATLKTIQANVLPENTGLSINISGKTLIQLGLIELFDPFVDWLGKYKIVIEVTENILIDHIDYAQKTLNQLRSKGFLIALDDFGSGYSSIRYLAHMPVDIIKFDITMTKALNADEKTQQIILTTAQMVRTAGFDLVMEGIETAEMFEQAKAAGATHLQGYLLGKPNAEIKPPTSGCCGYQ